ncbi:MAG TPA: CPBP family intramembrane glutamic endopeptidase [Kofleriaceae bacterium]|nr:CPBP family intramembrane glutamic endopeptidase [Kofleriaceae bacterium]
MSRAGRGTGRLCGRGDLGASLVLIFPLVLAYEIGVLFAGRVNGADLVTRAMYAAAGSRTAYLAIYAAIAAGFLIWIRHARRWDTLRFELAGPVILEAALYALTLGALVSLIVDHLFGRMLGLGLTAPSVISAIGAGVHEELVFRLALIAAVLALARPLDPRLAVGLAIAVSSLAFAAAHHVGAHGEPWTAHAFAFRAVAGAVFGAIFWFRSLAHAVYAHVFYDILVAAT